MHTFQAGVHVATNGICILDLFALPSTMFTAFRGPATRSAHLVRCASTWADSVQAAPLDPILGMSQRFQKDTDERKVNVSVGAYRTDEGKPLVLNCVKKAEAKVWSRPMPQDPSPPPCVLSCTPYVAQRHLTKHQAQ